MKQYIFLHIISKYSIYICIFSVLFILQNIPSVLSLFSDLTVFNKLYLHEIFLYYILYSHS